MKRRIPLGAPGKPKPGRKPRPGKPAGESASPKPAKKSARRRKPRGDEPVRPPRPEPAPPATPARRPVPLRLPDADHQPLALFAITAPGLEQFAAAELRALGIAAPVIEAGGVAFTGTLDDVYAANLWLRTASRVVIRIASFHASEFHELERRAKRVPWDRYIGVPARVRFRVTCRKSRLYHSDAVAERLAKIIAGVHGLPGGFAMASGDESVDDAADADDAQLFVVRLVHDEVTISADSSGALLHRRGYRQAVARAPLRETLAAAMVMGSGWDGTSPLADPMCGSGTIPIEAAMIARRMAPGIDHATGASRQFAFMGWAGFDDGAWRQRVAAAMAAAEPRVAGTIIGSDRDAGAIAAAASNAARAGVTDDISFRHHAISGLDLPEGPGCVVSNPPYGVRLGDTGPLRNLYAQLGKLLRARASGWTVALLTADRALERQVGVAFRDGFRTSNGGIPVRLVRGVVE